LAIIPTVTNNLLQGDFKKANNNTNLFMLNSSIGFLGMFDLSVQYHISKEKELSFSNTFVHYNYDTPFYFVLPILGPSTMTNLVTFIPDYFFNPQSTLSKKYKQYIFWSVLFNKKVQLLEKEVLMNISSSSSDEYAFVRNAYLQYNKFNIYY
jgi:phospholipid-binding lipoprotein MlaA